MLYVLAGQESGVGTAPGVYLREDPISGTQLENQSELRAPTAEKAAFYLDAALNARNKSGTLHSCMVIGVETTSTTLKNIITTKKSSTTSSTVTTGSWHFL